jgi:hypothetical protein
VQVLDGRVAVETSDGRQQVKVAGTGPNAKVRELPSTFCVVAAEQDGERVVLRAQDGREVRVTPGQLAAPTLAIPPELDPDHQAHMEAELLGLATVPAYDADSPTLTEPLPDERLGTIVFDPAEGVAARDVTTPLGPVPVRFASAGRDRVPALLPITYWIVDYLPQLLATAVEFLWQWGATGQDTADGHKEFVANFGVRGVWFYHCGAFTIELSDDQTFFAESFLDGYWPAVHFLADGQPIFVTIEC